MPNHSHKRAPVHGDTLRAGVGGWIGASEFTFQWNADGIPIEGATDQSYTPTMADIGKVLTVTVTAKNIVGEETVTSDDIPAVLTEQEAENLENQQ
jgi:hypothetical protein